MSALHAGSSRAPGWRTPRHRDRCEQHKADGEATIVTAQNEIIAGNYINLAHTMNFDKKEFEACHRCFPCHAPCPADTRFAK